MKVALAALFIAAVIVGHAAALRVHGPRPSISKSPEGDGAPKNPDYMKELGPNQPQPLYNAAEEMDQIAGDDGPPKNPNYARELGPKRPLLHNAALEITASAALQHGSRVSFQLKGYKCSWFACTSDTSCTGWQIYYTNAGLYQFNSDPITNFGVYRRNGPGNVVVGDAIALYYPKDSGKWFSMLAGKPHLSTCPGAPSSADGMSTEDSWYLCNGEAFKIYARNKKLGDAIVANDDVKLYYLGEGKMLSAWNNNCDGVVNPSRPPPSNSYTHIDTLEIWIA